MCVLNSVADGPIEGAIYPDPSGDGEFKVLFVGLYGRTPGFIIDFRNGELGVYGLNWWQIVFKEPASLRLEPNPKGHRVFGVHLTGVWCEAVKLESGEIKLIPCEAMAECQVNHQTTIQ